MGPINTDLVISKYKNHLFPKCVAKSSCKVFKIQNWIITTFYYLAHNTHIINISILSLPQNLGHNLIPFEL
jgi:hypothetical protein